MACQITSIFVGKNASKKWLKIHQARVGVLESAPWHRRRHIKHWTTLGRRQTPWFELLLWHQIQSGKESSYLWAKTCKYGKKWIALSSKAEKAWQKTYEIRQARQDFFRDLYQYGRSLLDHPKSGTLTTSQAELEECLTKTNSSTLQNRLLLERTEISEAPLQYIQCSSPVRKIERQETALHPASKEFHTCYTKVVKEPSNCSIATAWTNSPDAIQCKIHF